MTYQENIKRIINAKSYSEVVQDNTCNGICSKCGECCGNILPIDQEDADKIQEYVVKNKIFPQKQHLIMTRKLQCPYYTGNIEKGCAIYEARPKICRYFKCDLKSMSIDKFFEMQNAEPINMWRFELAIEREMRKCGIN